MNCNLIGHCRVCTVAQCKGYYACHLCYCNFVNPLSCGVLDRNKTGFSAEGCRHYTDRRDGDRCILIHHIGANICMIMNESCHRKLRRFRGIALYFTSSIHFEILQPLRNRKFFSGYYGTYSSTVVPRRRY